MEIVNKPDIQVFASEAKSGEVLKFPDILRGWGVTLDQTQGKPPLEWMNGAFNRIDLNNLYLLQQGIPEWHKSIRYPINSIVKKADKIYLCIVENENNEPSNNSDKWALYVSNASLTQKGIVQLTSTLSDDEDKALTPKGAQDLQKLVEQKLNDAIPVGVIVSWDHDVAPKNWLFVRDQKFSATEYPELAKLYPKLVLNDRRGTVDRALDAGRGYDSGRVLGSYQEDAMQKMEGRVAFRSTVGDAPLFTGASGPFYNAGKSGETGHSMVNLSGGFGKLDFLDFDTSRVSRSSNETRMKNVATNKIIKAK